MRFVCEKEKVCGFFAYKIYFVKMVAANLTTDQDHIDQRRFSDIYIRTTWIDARIALEQIEKVNPTEFTLMTL